MIRRGFWLLVGAAGGIVGYRRASALSRRAAEALGARPKRPGPVSGGTVSGGTVTRGTGTRGTVKRGTVKRRWARETIRFTRDVREGMDLYLTRHPGSGPSNLGAESRRTQAPAFIEASTGTSGGQRLPRKDNH